MPRWIDCRLVAFDTETTGLRPFDGDRIIEFGAVELIVDGEFRVQRAQRHDFLINPGMPIPRESSKVSGITDDDVADQPGFDHRAPRIRELLAGAILVAHNLAFDMAFLRAELFRCGLSWPSTLAEIDTLPLSQRLLKHLRQHKLGMICKDLGIDLVEAHRASNDAEACGRAFVELARRHGAPDDLSQMVIWADAASAPPDTGHLAMGPQGVPVFLDGPHAGRSVEEHPEILQWMAIALVRKGEAFVPRFPEEVREWARRWLRARASSRARASARGGDAKAWGLDPAPWRRA